MGTRTRENQITEETEVVSRSRAERSTPILSESFSLEETASKIQAERFQFFCYSIPKVMTDYL